MVGTRIDKRKTRVRVRESDDSRSRQRYDRMAVLDRIQLLVNIMKVQADWNQVEFAAKAGLTTPKLSHYLARRYRPDLDSLASVAEKLGVSMEWLVFGAGPMWARDLDRGGYGKSEVILAMSSALAQLADSLRQTVITKKSEHEPVDPLGILEAVDMVLGNSKAP